MHSLFKGNSVGSHIRKIEVDRMMVPDFDEYIELLKLPPQDITIKYMRIDQPPPEYTEKENAGILPPWPGPGILYRIVCYPSNRSDISRGNWKMPTIFILNDDTSNPLNCSDVFKSVGAIRCFNCPSVNGSLGGCCHIGFMFMLLSAPYILQSTNRPVQLVNMKNKFSFLDPEGVTTSVLSHTNISTSVVRRSRDKRINSVIYHPEDNLECDESFVQSDEDVSTPAPAQSEDVVGTPIPRRDSDDSPVQREGNTPSERNDARNATGSCQDDIGSCRPNSQVSSSQSLYGYSRTNIDAFIRRRVQRNPSRAIPPANVNRGKECVFFSR